MREQELSIFGIAGLNERAMRLIEGWKAKRTSRHHCGRCGNYHLREFSAGDGRVAVEEVQKRHNGYVFHALRDLRQGKFIPMSLWRKREIEAFPDEPVQAKRKIAKRR